MLVQPRQGSRARLVAGDDQTAMCTAPTTPTGPFTVALAAGLPMLAETLAIALKHRGHQVQAVPCPVAEPSLVSIELPQDAAVGILVCGPDDTAIGRDVAMLVQSTALPWLVVLDRASDSGRERAHRAGAAEVLTAGTTLDELERVLGKLAAGSVAGSVIPSSAGSLPAG